MLRKAARGVFVSSYFILLIIYLAASATPSLNPSRWWWVGFTGLIFPYILLLVVLITILFLFYRPRLSLYGIIALMLSYKDIRALVAIRVPHEFVLNKKQGFLRVMTWNVRRFTPVYADLFDPRNNNLEDIAGEVNRYDPDILCLQEFYTGPGKNTRNLEHIKETCHFQYYVFSEGLSPVMHDQSGTIIFSKYPIIQSYVYRLPENISYNTETPVFADILAGGDTIRVGTVHMQSYGFLSRDYKDLSKIKNQEDSGLKASKNIFRKMRFAFSQRGKQADVVRQKIEESDYPTIVCGDLNDVPNSYAYFRVRKEMKDAFLEKGSGLGKSFFSGRSKFLTWLPTLRIDYVFTDPEFNIDQFTMVRRKLSDHRGLITDIEVPKK